MRTFPYEHASRRQARFFPCEPTERTIVDWLEVGPGRGDFLLAEAGERPETRFAAIEIKRRRYLKLIGQVQRRNLNNVLLVQGDARIVIPDLIPSNSLSAAYILFPDPWPKRRHTGMRLLSVEFLQMLTDRLLIGGELVVATDDQEFARWMRNNILKVPALTIEAERTSAEEGPVHTATHYEKKWRAEGRIITTFRCRRVQSDHLPPGPEEKELP